MTGRDVLVRTRRLFSAGQWTRGIFHTRGRDGVDRYCLVGGLRHSAFGKPIAVSYETKKPFNFGAYSDAKNAIYEANGCYELMSFNDGCRGPEPVIEAIDKAIAYIDEHKRALVTS